MSNVLRTEKQEQVRALGRLGWSLRRIEEETGIRRETVSRYLKASGIDIRRPRGRRAPESAGDPKAASQPTIDSGSASKAASQVTTDLEREAKPGWSRRVSGCEPYRDLVEAWVNRGRTASAIWQDLVDDHGFESSYECVKRFVRKLRGTPAGDPHPRIVTAPGEEAQVDYGGDGPLVRDAETGKYRRVRLFAMTLGFSRKSAWLLARKSSSQIWSELHELAFRRLGGTPRTVVLDYVPRHIIELLCPAPLCGHGRRQGERPEKRHCPRAGWAHNDQSEASQSSNAASERHTGLRGHPSESSSGGSHKRSAASFARVLISA